MTAGGSDVQTSDALFFVCDFAVGPRAETGNVAAGKRRGTGGPRARPARAESAATPPSGAETLRRPSLRESGRGSERGRRRRRTRRKRRRSC